MPNRPGLPEQGPESEARINLGEIAMNFKVRSDQTPGGVAVQEWEIGPRKLAAPPHRHEHEDEIFYVLDGEVSVLQDDQVFTAGTGSCVILPRGRFHTFWNSADHPARLLVILSPGRLERYFERAGQLFGGAGPTDLGELERLMQEYGLTFQLERMPELAAPYGLDDGTTPAGGSADP